MAKINNFNAMRPVIVIAHNEGNRKAINKDMVAGAGIDNQQFIQWQSDVRKLMETVREYVTLKKNSRFDASITEDDLYSARERIFPKWKEILSVGEEKKDTKQLKVDPNDVEDLIGFAWDFMATSKGTVETVTSDMIFRKKVESLLGCAIAKNAILNDHDRETLDTYYKAQNRIQRCIDTKAELDEKIKSYELLKKETDDKKFLEFIDNNITVVKEELKANAESKANAEATLKEVQGEAKKIEQKIKLAK